MRMLKIYLETTIFNYYFDYDRDAHPYTLKLFDEIKQGKYEAYTSVYTLAELNRTEEIKRNKMLSLIDKYAIKVLDSSSEAESLANLYIQNGIIPPKQTNDALHIAISSVNDIDIILSLNFRHIVKRKVIAAVEFINKNNGYSRIEINAPMEVVDDEN